MAVEKRVIVAPDDRERTAIVSIAMPAGFELEIDPTWRFLGWRDEMKVKVKRHPRRITVEGDTDA